MSMPFSRIGIVGLGLMGSSLAARIGQVFQNFSIYGVDEDQNTLEQAREKGYIIDGGTAVSALPQDLDIVFVCTPIESIETTLKAISSQVNDTTILSDIASVKQVVETAVNALSLPQLYIPGHPMCGRERSGIAHCAPDMFDGCSYVLMPQNQPQYASFKAFVQALIGEGQVVECSAVEHDRAVGYCSHRAYIASHLAKGLKQKDEYKAFFGPGFKDTTRVSHSDPRWGVSVCQHNSAAILNEIKEMKDQLSAIEDAVLQADNRRLLTFFKP